MSQPLYHLLLTLYTVTITLYIIKLMYNSTVSMVTDAIYICSIYYRQWGYDLQGGGEWGYVRYRHQLHVSISERPYIHDTAGDGTP